MGLFYIILFSDSIKKKTDGWWLMSFRGKKKEYYES